MHEDTLRRFRRIGTLTIATVYFLILVGAIVRASGAGMGCPDWPTCFGQWIPPTDESQLPANYHEIYAQRGYADTRFNPVKTWTEYLNRLTGVTTGLLIILTVWAALPFRRGDPPVFYAALAALLLVVFQGWLGAVVVSSNLHPLMITAHMLMALVIVALLIYAVIRAEREALTPVHLRSLQRRHVWLLGALLLVTLIQIGLGAQVREAVDAIAKAHQFTGRRHWPQELPWVFYWHRGFALALLCANLAMAWRLLRLLPQRHLLFRLTLALGLLVFLAVGTGIGMERLGIPPWLQPLHLLIANLIFGIQFTLLVTLHYCCSVPAFPSERVQGFTDQPQAATEARQPGKGS
ncbi:cytochrome c oxidase assembly protein subunit 15 [Methylomarinovum tepidoasis]|uniref:Cytochrome c oxidase assembly protein subunit 15 n=1 Tax=Methylomarinovum tepidoasis TaxID=2840183 RepID=A0AAU9C9E5_9GAMM|nr:COX15/CtaA family protein [Methylomarinovum sp. IN45]BCX89944.1 cytochrome c oxidase assembly protein subunit 15 [Methylomarinovum sp. IN45]